MLDEENNTGEGKIARLETNNKEVNYSFIDSVV